MHHIYEGCLNFKIIKSNVNMIVFFKKRFDNL